MFSLTLFYNYSCQLRIQLCIIANWFVSITYSYLYCCQIVSCALDIPFLGKLKAPLGQTMLLFFFPPVNSMRPVTWTRIRYFWIFESGSIVLLWTSITLQIPQQYYECWLKIATWLYIPNRVVSRDTVSTNQKVEIYTYL
jgi:hypothetical protein